ncbi:hypothetical protein PIB30_087169 [Stylosanthes scabra]|uniref:Replication protein A 70 kDa DNA-binding subunit B/D first OB fold domain-containing protein n=1 Tax=Stylosanthes scabra TaxID=79078 RepID=A0ABU6STL5_9FABA|nr:hypothetical protein [Stylosanthes scabra]
MRLIRHWKVPSVLDRKYKDSIEIVFIDSEGDRISAMIRPFHVRQFDAILNDGNIYVVSNVAIAPNDIKFKTTTHKYRLIFKRDTRIQPSLDDDKIPRQQFHFLPTSKILSETRDDVCLIDYMGLLIAKGELTKFTNNQKPSFFIGIVLDDMTNNSMLGNSQVEISPIVWSSSYNLSDDLLNINNYATISHIKGTKEQGCYLETLKNVAISVTYKQLVSFDAKFCITSYLPIIGISASDLVAKLVKLGDDLEKYPEDINKFVGKTYIFKVNAAMSSVTYFQPCIITISKITSDDELLKLYMIKYNVDLGFVAISTKSTNGAAASGAHISNPQESFAKTPSPPALKKSRLSQKDTTVIGTPGPKGSDIHGSPIANSNEFKPSA